MAKKKDTKADDKIIVAAKTRFKQCEEWEATFRRLFVDDLKFANADSDNGYQWPDQMMSTRTLEQRPTLTINKTRQHNLQIINDAKQNKPAVTVHPVGNGATYEASQIFEGVIRHIEYVSNAQIAYDTATEFQVMAGLGYWRIVTDYANNESFDQEIFIRRVKDPLGVYLDPDIKEADGSDAKFGFIFDDMKKEDFNLKYPEYKDVVGTGAPLGVGQDWITEDHVRVCEYYAREIKMETLVALPMQDGNGVVMKKLSEIRDADPEAAKIVEADDTIQKREVESHKVMWYMIGGDCIIDRNEWIGTYIPIVRVIGEEIIIEGKLDRKGHTRALKDPQRMYNYWTSSAVEFVALQGKQPWVAPVEAIEGFENYYATANTVNHAYLPYNGLDEAGNQIAKPERQMPPVMAQGYIQGMQNAAEEMKMVSGQYDALMGAPSNETSGVAIQGRQRQGDRATYQYIDNLARAIRFTGKQLIELIPKVYDTPRVIRILGEDGSDDSVQLDPEAKKAYMEEKIDQTNQVKKIFNPAVGIYDVVSDVGPAYATRRLEAFNAFSQLMQQNPDLMKVAGDLMFKAADFPMADELAERLKRTIPSNVLGDAPPPEIEQMQSQMQQMGENMKHLVTQLADKTGEATYKQEEIQVKKYEAETDRMKVIQDKVPPEMITQMAGEMAAQLLQNTMKTDLTAVPQPPAEQSAMLPPQGGQLEPQGAVNA